MLTVLNVAYPLARIGPEAVGGAEQVLAQIDRALVAAGHRSLVLACEGSQTAGTLVAHAAAGPDLGPDAVAAAHGEVGRLLRAALRRWTVDLVHMHGFDFHRYLPPPGVPVLATLHCPRQWYARQALHPARPQTWLNAVSREQHGRLLPNPRLLAAIENGVPLADFADVYEKADYALFLGRIAPEKGVHVALDAARSAGLPLIVAGEVFGYPEHVRYWQQEVAPRLDAERRVRGPVGGRHKARLLGRARCVVIASQVAETSSLLAREALAAGTPVVAFPQGALADLVEDGRTGFLVGSVGEMAVAMRAAAQLDPEQCRAAARERCCGRRMTARYLAVYAALAAGHSRELAAAAQP